MGNVRQLNELQEVDWHVDAHRKELAAVEARLKDDLGVTQARAEVEHLQAKLQRLRRDQREAEIGAEDVEAKTSQVEKRLFSGAVRNPRELTGLQLDFEHLKERRRQAEERVLEIMGQVEEVETQLGATQARLRDLEEEWRARQEQLGEERRKLLQEMEGLDAQREAMAAGVEASDLSLYERLRASRGGHAVARLERGMCLGCRIALPTKEIQQVRTASGPVQCPSCGRILYMS